MRRVAIPIVLIAVGSYFYVLSDRTFPIASTLLVSLAAALFLTVSEEVFVASAAMITSLILVALGDFNSAELINRSLLVVTGNILAVVIAHQRTHIRMQHRYLELAKEISLDLVACESSPVLMGQLASLACEATSADACGVIRVLDNAGFRTLSSANSGTLTAWSTEPVQDLAVRATLNTNGDSIATIEIPDESGSDDVTYAAAVSIGSNARNKMALVVLWDSKHKVSSYEQQLLESIAATAAQVNDRISLFEDQRTIASALQHSLLTIDDLEGNCVASARYRPAVRELEVGGDWYDVIQLDDDHVAIIVGDVVGKGVAASATMSQLRGALSAMAMVNECPSEVLSRLDGFASRVDGAIAATIVCAVIDLPRGIVQACSAGHPPPIVLRANGEVELIDGPKGWPIGGRAEGTRPVSELKIQQGDTIVFYTDGLVERREQIIDSGIDSLANFGRDLRQLPTEQFCDELLAKMTSSGPLRDDAVVVAFRLLSAPTGIFRSVIPASPKMLGKFRRDLESWLTSHQVNVESRNDIVLSASEAITNAIEHSGASENGSTIDIRGKIEDDSVTLIVSDRGRWNSFATSHDRGRGIQIINDVMDYVCLDATASGTIVRMTKHAKRAS